MKVFDNAKNKSFGNEFARYAYRIVSNYLKIDPIKEGRLTEKKIQKILIPDDIKIFTSEDERNKAEERANKIVDIYIERSKKFWRVFQLYCYNYGRIRATALLSSKVKNSDVELKRLYKENKEILNDTI